jgi:FAD:protein FMN transferase
MKKAFSIIILTLIIFSCSTGKLVKFTGFAQGTTYSISYYDRDGKNYQHEVDSILNDFNSSVSIYDSASLISKINSSASPVKVDKYVDDIFKRSCVVSEQTAGAFDVTVGPLVNAFGFGFKNKEKISPAHIDSLKILVNYKNAKIENGYFIKKYAAMSIDFNAIAQGYSVDLISKFLESKGIEKYCVEIGGEVFAKGKKTDGENWNVGIEKPDDNMTNQSLKATVRLEDKALATSGNYRKFYIENGVKYSHEIDPATAYPVKHSLLSVSVLADNCTDADAYATAFMVMGLERSLTFLKDHKELEAYFIYSDHYGSMKTRMTDGMRQLLEEKK